MGKNTRFGWFFLDKIAKLGCFFDRSGDPVVNLPQGNVWENGMTKACGKFTTGYSEWRKKN
jgi:hypothetical protein